MTDIFAFLDSEQGSHMFSDASFVTFASLKRGAFAWIPFGHIYVPIGWAQEHGLNIQRTEPP